MKASELVLNYNRLAEVAGKNKLYPAKINYALAKNILVMEQEVKIYSQNKNDIVKKFAVVKEDGSPVVADDKYTFENEEKQEQFISAMVDLEATDIEIDIHKVPYSVIEDADAKYDQPTAADLIALDIMLTE